MIVKINKIQRLDRNEIFRIYFIIVTYKLKRKNLKYRIIISRYSASRRDNYVYIIPQCT